MKKTSKVFKKIAASFIAISIVLSFAACANKADNTGSQNNESKIVSEKDSSDVWNSAIYTENTEVGNGSKTVNLSISANDKKIEITIHTDDKTLGDALLKNNLITGENSEYGMYIKSVNGITADYDKDKAYWAFYCNGNYMSTGVDTTDIAGGEHFELVYTK